MAKHTAVAIRQTVRPVVTEKLAPGVVTALGCFFCWGGRRCGSGAGAVSAVVSATSDGSTSISSTTTSSTGGPPSVVPAERFPHDRGALGEKLRSGRAEHQDVGAAQQGVLEMDGALRLGGKAHLGAGVAASGQHLAGEEVLVGLGGPRPGCFVPTQLHQARAAFQVRSRSRALATEQRDQSGLPNAASPMGPTICHRRFNTPGRVTEASSGATLALIQRLRFRSMLRMTTSPGRIMTSFFCVR